MSEVAILAVVGAVVVIGAIVVLASRRRSPAPTPTPERAGGHRGAYAKSLTPLQELAADRRKSLDRRKSTCARIAGMAILPEDKRPDDGEFAGFLTMAVDEWLGRDFTLRARAVGMSWLPFVDAPEHQETPEIARERLNRNYRLNAEEREAMAKMELTQPGRIAVTAARVADRIHRTPVWEMDFFDRHHVRVDLAAEVAQLTDSAKTLSHQQDLLGLAPMGERAMDADIVGVYIEKARILDTRTEALLARLEALDSYRAIVVEVQKRAEKQEWLDRVNAIDDLDTTAAAVTDQLHADSLRDTALESHAGAQVYLPNLGSLTARLTAAEK